MAQRQEFITKVREWLLPLGYEEIYRVNHPTDVSDEIHFIKDAIRACCVLQKGEEFFYMNADVIGLTPIMALRSCKYPIGDSKINEIHNAFLQNRRWLLSNSKKEAKQNFFSVDGQTARSSHGEYFSVGEIVAHDDKEVGEAKILCFEMDANMNEVWVQTDKGYAYLDFLVKVQK